MYQKQTKIVATISDRNCGVEFLRSLYFAGMNVVRINTAHQTPDASSMIVRNVREISDKIAILVDTKGPEIRTTSVDPPEGIDVKVGEILKVSGHANGISSKEHLYVNYDHFVEDLAIGNNILIDDGDISLKVTGKQPDYLECEVCDSGKIKAHKSVNVPNVPIRLPSLSAKDLEFIDWAVAEGIDFIAHSFVRNKEDVLAIQKILDARGSSIKIIAKIENQEGVDHSEEILEHAYGMMVARGDLGVEIAAEKIPVIQRELIAQCHSRQKPVIIATQMLHTMIEHPRPTRAEVSDVANAIYQRTDAIMLSGETASGNYALEAVQTMTRIACEIEQHLHPQMSLQLHNPSDLVSATLARSVVEASTFLPIQAIVFDTLNGRSGRYLSAFRPKVPVFAKCYKKSVMRELALSYGIRSYFMEPHHSKDDFVRVAVQSLLDEKCFETDDLIAVIGGSFGPTMGASFMEISLAKNIASVNYSGDWT